MKDTSCLFYFVGHSRKKGTTCSGGLQCGQMYFIGESLLIQYKCKSGRIILKNSPMKKDSPESAKCYCKDFRCLEKSLDILLTFMIRVHLLDIEVFK